MRRSRIIGGPVRCEAYGCGEAARDAFADVVDYGAAPVPHVALCGVHEPMDEDEPLPRLNGEAKRRVYDARQAVAEREFNARNHP